MRGIGRIFEAYRDERLVDDDDVALIHGPAEAGWAPVTEAMVNVTATLDAAIAAGELVTDQGERIATSAKAVFYKERTWRLILEAAAAAGAPVPETFVAWLGTGAIDQKRLDAQELVRQVRALAVGRPAADEKLGLRAHRDLRSCRVARDRRGRGERL